MGCVGVVTACLLNRFLQPSPGQQQQAAEQARPPLVFEGPILPTDSEIITSFNLPHLAIDVAIAPSTVAPQGLGLFVRVADHVAEEGVMLPHMTVLAGYSRPGVFNMTDSGDRAVLFIVPSLQTPVVYNEEVVQLVSALNAAAVVAQNGTCTILSHKMEPIMSDDGVYTGEVKISPEFQMFFIPAEVHNVKDEITIESVGQYANDLAWSNSKPPSSSDDYAQRSAATNIIEMVWRVEYDSDLNGLKPMWPVIVLNKDVAFTNKKDFMEIGLQYGWSYWQTILERAKAAE